MATTTQTPGKREAQRVPRLQAGDRMTAEEFERRKFEWLPSPADSEYLLSIMAEPIYEPGKFANYIAPPRRGVNQLPVNFEYVRTES